MRRNESPRKGERIDLERIEGYIRRFGPLTTTQLTKAFGMETNGLRHKLLESPKVKMETKDRRNLWTYIGGPQELAHSE